MEMKTVWAFLAINHHEPARGAKTDFASITDIRKSYNMNGKEVSQLCQKNCP
jgi:hypothetical protein